MDRVFQITAAVLAVVAAYFIWEGSKDMAFASAVLASVAFFLSVRAQAKERIRTREAEAKAKADEASEEAPT